MISDENGLIFFLIHAAEHPKEYLSIQNLCFHLTFFLRALNLLVNLQYKSLFIR